MIAKECCLTCTVGCHNKDWTESTKKGAIESCLEYDPRNPVESKHEKMWNRLKLAIRDAKPENEIEKNLTTKMLDLLNFAEKECLK